MNKRHQTVESILAEAYSVLGEGIFDMFDNDDKTDGNQSDSALDEVIDEYKRRLKWTIQHDSLKVVELERACYSGDRSA